MWALRIVRKEWRGGAGTQSKSYERRVRYGRAEDEKIFRVWYWALIGCVGVDVDVICNHSHFRKIQ